MPFAGRQRGLRLPQENRFVVSIDLGSGKSRVNSSNGFNVFVKKSQQWITENELLKNQKFKKELEMKKNELETGVKGLGNDSRELYQQNCELRQLVLDQAKWATRVQNLLIDMNRKKLSKNTTLDLIIDANILEKRKNKALNQPNVKGSEDHAQRMIDEKYLKRIPKIEEIVKLKLNQIQSKDIHLENTFGLGVKITKDEESFG